MSLHVAVVLTRSGLRHATEDALRRAGYRATAFCSSMEAWSLVKNCDVLVTEIRLATGQPSGIALARGGQFANPRLKILFLAKEPHDRSYVSMVGDILPAGTSPEAIAAYVGRIEWWRTASSLRSQQKRGDATAGASVVRFRMARECDRRA